MRPLLPLAACLLLLAACATTSAAPPQPNPAAIDLVLEPVEGSVVRVLESVETERYLVSGDSAAAIRASLNRNGPGSKAGHHGYDAVTRWGLKWSFRYEDVPDGCRLAAGTIEVAAVVLLPELEGRGRVLALTLERWDEYIQALTEHEAGHVDAVLRGAHALSAAMGALGSMPSCRELGAALNALGEAYDAAMQAADVEYDENTDHGRSQGAEFP